MRDDEIWGHFMGTICYACRRDGNLMTDSLLGPEPSLTRPSEKHTEKQ